MALTPEGTPYVESSDLVANYPAASLSLANRVDLVGVLPFATSTARSTAIPSPTDGQYSYLQDTNVTEFWNGSAWQAAGTAPGLVHINTTTFTTQATVSVNNVFTATYDNYKIIYDSTLSGNVAFNMRLRVGGVDTATNYSYQNSQFSTAAGISQALSQTLMQIFGASGAARFNIATEVFTPFLTSATGVINNYSATGISGLATGTHTASTSFDGFTIYPATGTISGTLRVFGYKNS